MVIRKVINSNSLLERPQLFHLELSGCGKARNSFGKFFYHLGPLSPRLNKGHVSPEDVDDLGDLIEGRGAE